MRGRTVTILTWALQVIAAAILVQTLFFKFIGAEESRFIFQTLGVEPWGRYAAGTAELITAILLLIPQTAAIGAAMGLGVITGAILAHLTKLGIVVKDDGGLLFGLACAVFACCAGVVFLRRAELPIVGRFLVPAPAAALGT